MNNKHSAFTLIELLVVIAIIAILAAILFPVFAQAREKGRQASCISNEKQLSLGMLQYIQDYDEFFPGGSDGYLSGTYTFVDNPGCGWAGQIYAYIKNTAVYKCPDDPTQGLPALGAFAQSYPVSYSYNTDIADYAIDGFEDTGGYYFGYGSGYPVHRFDNPAKTVLFSEVYGAVANVVSPDEKPYGNNGKGQQVLSPSDNGDYWGFYAQHPASYSNTTPAKRDTGYLGPYGVPSSSFKYYRNAKGRHSDGAVFSMADGHAKWLRGTSVSPGAIAPSPDYAGYFDGTWWYSAGTGAPFGATYSIH